MMVLGNLSAGTAAVALALAPARPPLNSDAEIPGGYHEMIDLRGTEPPDGDNKVTLGSVLFSLGLIQFAGGMTSFVLASPDRCASVYGASVTEKTCSGLQVYGLVGAALGGLMAASGGALLGIGLVQRQKHRKWMREAGLAIGPMVGPGHGGVTLGFRF